MRDVVLVLLEYLRDVELGINERPGDPEQPLGMCRAWNHPSYRQLRALIARMPERLRVPVRVYYLAYEERRVAWCRRCGVHPASAVKSIHKHPPGRSVRLQPRILRIWPRYDGERLAEGIEWLCERWQGAAVVPEQVHAIERERRLRAA